MPEMRFDTRWPDGYLLTSYSPSLVVKDHLQAGARYSVDEFHRRTWMALNEASERVRVRFGSHCTRALGALSDIEWLVRQYPAGGEVEVVSMEPE